MKIKLVSAALLALLACSCTEGFNDKNGVDGTNTMQVNAYIGKSPVTRAEKTAWENNDQLGVYVVDNSIDVPYKGSASYSNIPFVFTGKGSRATISYLMRMRVLYTPIIPIRATLRTRRLYRLTSASRQTTCTGRETAR